MIFKKSYDIMTFGEFFTQNHFGKELDHMKKRIVALLLAAMLLISLLAACGEKAPAQDSAEGTTSASDPITDPTTEPTTKPSTTEPTTEPTTGPQEPPADPPSGDTPTPPTLNDPSVYSGTPDTSWYTGDKTEYILTSADQLVGFHHLRSETTTFEGVTLKLACDVIFNPGTTEEIKAKGDGNHEWKGCGCSRGLHKSPHPT